MIFSKELYLIKAVSIFLIILATPYIAIFAYLGLYLPSVLVGICIITYIFCIIFRKWYIVSGLILIITTSLALLYCASAFGKASGAHLFYFGFMSIAVTLFISKNKIALGSGVCIPFFCIVALEYNKYSFFQTIELAPILFTGITYFAYVTSSCIIGLSIYSFYLSNRYYQNQLQDKLHESEIQRDQLENAHKELKQKEILDKEMTIAKQLQFGLMPQAPPEYDHFNIQVYYQSCRQIGGDYYDFIPIGKHELLGVVADIAGKGIPASIMMMHFRNLIHKCFTKDTPLSRLMEELNNIIIHNYFIQKSVACTLWRLNTKMNQLSVATAGMDPSILIQNEKVKQLDSIGGFSLGMFEDSLYDSMNIQLQKNDKVLFFTDGIFDQRNDQNQHYGYDPFIQLIERCATLDNAKMMDTIISEIKEFSGSMDRSDDTLLMALHHT
jgi:serine phosphatase RsbU (regulator of sigma subunit)